MTSPNSNSETLVVSASTSESDSGHPPISDSSSEDEAEETDTFKSGDGSCENNNNNNSSSNCSSSSSDSTLSLQDADDDDIFDDTSDSDDCELGVTEKSDPHQHQNHHLHSVFNALLSLIKRLPPRRRQQYCLPSPLDFPSSSALFTLADLHLHTDVQHKLSKLIYTIAQRQNWKQRTKKQKPPKSQQNIDNNCENQLQLSYVQPIPEKCNIPTTTAIAKSKPAVVSASCSSPIVEVTTTSNVHLLDHALALYTKNFPGQAELSISAVLEFIDRGIYRLLVMPADDSMGPDNKVAALAIVGILAQHSAYCHLDYVCVNENCRGKGLGTSFFRHLAAFLAQEGRHSVLTLECERHLISWYSRLGALESGIADSFFPAQKEDGLYRFMILQLAMFTNTNDKKSPVANNLIAPTTLRSVMAELRDRVHNMSCSREFTIMNEETHETTHVIEWV